MKKILIGIAILTILMTGCATTKSGGTTTTRTTTTTTQTDTNTGDIVIIDGDINIQDDGIGQPQVITPEMRAEADEHYAAFKLAQGRKDYGTAAQEANAACALRHAQACFESGKMAQKIKDMDGAKDKFAIACEENHSLGCSQLGVTLINIGDKQGGVAALDKACELGDGISCGNLGLLYSGLKSVLPKDEREAKRYYAKACKNGANDTQKKIDFCDMAK